MPRGRCGRPRQWRRAHERRTIRGAVHARPARRHRRCQARQDTCVVAGPGSGKTTVLVEYFRRLVEAGVDPLRILAITFTEKAAGNMRAKLAEDVSRRSGSSRQLERAWVSTVHGFCARLLSENAVFAGVDPEFTVADERESWRMQQEAMAAAMDALFARASGGGAGADPRAFVVRFRAGGAFGLRCHARRRAGAWRNWPLSRPARDHAGRRRGGRLRELRVQDTAHRLELPRRSSTCGRFWRAARALCGRAAARSAAGHRGVLRPI